MRGKMIGLILVVTSALICAYSMSQLMEALFDIGRMAVQLGLSAA